MRVLLAASAAFFVALCSEASAFGAHVQPPPARYDHPFRGRLVINYVDDIVRSCQAGNVFGRVVGCAYLGRGQCTILIAKGVSEQMRQDLIRHETAHCNGWPANHPM